MDGRRPAGAALEGRHDRGGRDDIDTGSDDDALGARGDRRDPGHWSTTREDLVVDRTGHQERLRWFLVELAIDEPAARSLDRTVILDRLEAELAGRTEPVARFARDLLVRIRELTGAIDGLEREVRTLAAPGRPLAPGPHRLRAADRGQARRPDGRGRSLPLAGRVRSP